MQAFTILRLRRLPNGSGQGFSGDVVCAGQREPFSVITEGGSLVVTLAGLDLRLAVDPFVAMRCHWHEISDAVRDGLGRLMSSPSYAAQRQIAEAA